MLIRLSVNKLIFYAKVKIDKEMEEELLYILLLSLSRNLLMLSAAKIRTLKRKVRRWWIRPVNYPRESQGIYNNLFRELKNTDHEEFFEYTRMAVQQFNYICDLVNPYLSKRSIRTPLPVKLRVAITLE